jgi:hypothetical protein
MNLESAYTRHLDWRSGAMQSQEPLVMCQVCSPTCCRIGNYFCKGCSRPLCAGAADQCNCETGLCHDVVTFSEGVQRGLCRRADWES